MVLNKSQKYAIKKDRLNCVSCNDSIKGAAVKAGGNFWCKVYIYRNFIVFINIIVFIKNENT